MLRPRASALGEKVKTILLDIEGTTTPVEFVTRVLFPYAHSHVEEFLRRHGQREDVRADIEALRKDYSADKQRKLDPPRWRNESDLLALESIVAYVHWLMDHDRKATALKSLQGKIWEAGYRSGELKSEVFPDVPLAFSRWQRQHQSVSIFSSGSVLAQKLLFAHTTAGDLTPFIENYFDTNTGAKTEAESYRRIATAHGLVPQEILFVSDVTAELDAARLARIETALCVRPGRPEPLSSSHPVVHTFDEILHY